MARILEKCIYTGNGNFGPTQNPYKTLTKKCIYTGDGFSFGAKNKKCIYTKVYMNEVLIRLDEVVFSMSCVYEHIYRRVLIGSIFGQKQIQD